MSDDKTKELAHGLAEQEKIAQDLDEMLNNIARTASPNLGASYVSTPYRPISQPEPVERVTLESLNEKVENIYNLLRLIGSAVLKEGLKDEKKK